MQPIHSIDSSQIRSGKVTQEKSQENGIPSFSQIVTYNGKDYKITVYFHTAEEIDLETAKTALDKQVLSMIKLAKACGVTTGEMESVTWSPGEKTLKGRLSGVGEVDVLTHLQEKLDIATGDDKTKIQEQINTIKTITDIAIKQKIIPKPDKTSVLSISVGKTGGTEVQIKVQKLKGPFDEFVDKIQASHKSIHEQHVDHQKMVMVLYQTVCTKNFEDKDINKLLTT